MKYNLTIVTAASSNHFLCLQSLLWTVSEFHPTARVIVWDIGLTTDQHSYLLDTPPFYLADWELRTFDFAKYPAHFALAQNAGRMAFRPVTVQAAAHECGGIVLWLDAGCQLRADAHELLATIQKNGVYCAPTGKTVAEKLYPAARVALAVTSAMLPLQLRDAGICAFDTTNPQVMTLLDRWASVALDPNITAPVGSTRWTHRQDAIFTVLLHQAGFNATPRLPGLRLRCDGQTLAETKFRIRGH